MILFGLEEVLGLYPTRYGMNCLKAFFLSTSECQGLGIVFALWGMKGFKIYEKKNSLVD